MNNLINIQSQIDKLQKQAQQIKAKEFQKTVFDIQEQMRVFGITAKDLKVRSADKGVSSTKPQVKVPRKTSGNKVPAKFRNSDGESWSGRGLMPRWLKTLVADGRSKEEFLVQ